MYTEIGSNSKGELQTESASFERIEPRPEFGLTEEQVKSRVSAHADNCKVKSATKSVSKIIRGNVFTYFNLVFSILGALLALVGAWTDMVFLLVLLANTCIGIIQEIHAKKVLDKMTILSEPKCRVIREGMQKEVLCEELVLDDVVCLEAGNQIPADGVVLQGILHVNEALLTGESDEVEKRPGEELLSGSFVVSGEAVARLTGVGKDSYISKLTLQATKTKEGEQSEMIRSLNYLIIVMGVIIVPIGIALFVQSYRFNGENLYDSITTMVAAVIGMVPEGLYLLASVALAVGTMRLAGKRVLVHDMKCMETLARVDVLCVDKTGTITEPGMQVYAWEDLPAGEVFRGENAGKSEIRQILSDFVQNMSTDNETMEVLQEYFNDTTGKKADKVQGFSSQTKSSFAEFEGKAYVLGAPEFVLKKHYEEFRNRIEEYGSRGFRVLLFGEVMKNEKEKQKQAEAETVLPLALVVLANPIRKGAKETFSYFEDGQVQVKVISGDNPLTVSAIAAEAGISGADAFVDASTLKTPEQLREAVEQYTVFGRVTPEQKRLLVGALKANKKTVAMTGDGVNDVLALKDADCSIAMASGSDAAVSVSQLVLLDSDFSRMPAVVMEGRRVVGNIERTACLYIVKNIFSMLLAIFSMLLLWNYPLVPAQVSLISLFTIGLPSFILALEPNKDPIRGHFLTNVLLRALPAGLTDFIVVSGLVVFCREFQVDLECLSTSCTILLAIVGFMILYRIAKPMHIWHILMMVALVGGCLFCMIFVSGFFAITGISRQCAMLMVIFAVITEPMLRYLGMAADRLLAIVHGRKKAVEG